MLFASTLFENFSLYFILFLIYVAYIGNKVAASKGPISSAAKDYATRKAVGFFTRFLK